MYDILLQLPAKTLCRLRAVCRPWRSLLSSPMFIAARHPGPHLLIAGYGGGTEQEISFSIMDLSGDVIKRVRRKDGDRIMGISSDLVCIKAVHDGGSYRLVNPATGAVHRLPQHLAQEHVAQGLKLRDYCEPVHMFGLVSNGECKVLRMLPRRNPDGGANNKDRLLEVCTLNSSRRRARWRGVTQLQGASMSLVWDDWTAIDGVVYLLKGGWYLRWIVTFDLETEQWRPSIAGPGYLIDPAGMLGEHHAELLRLELFVLTNLDEEELDKYKAQATG
ncbi:hypothetical protein U9M48_019905 [Paspalum notatum var. saurae]|uniref:F-box domain-containing protein n=1 Tax=Paspalum notatum var. saurae TaxID=547442 RepID=A0AAQ3WRE3_PASNO